MKQNSQKQENKRTPTIIENEWLQFVLFLQSI